MTCCQGDSHSPASLADGSRALEEKGQRDRGMEGWRKREGGMERGIERWRDI